MKKPLPDHRQNARKAEYHCPTDDEVIKLAGDYGFAASFDLASRLEAVYINEETVRCADEDAHTPKEQKKLLEALRDRSLAIEEAVTMLGSDERCLLYDSCLNIPELSQFQRDSHHLYLAAHAAFSELKNKKGKRQPQENIWNFIWQLADIWQEGTGKPPTCSHNNINSCFVGDFYLFACGCAVLGGFTLRQSGSLVRDILHEWRSRQN